MKKKIHYKQGDIYLVKFYPTVGGEIGKYRPAVVVSELVEKIDEDLILIAPFTSNPKYKSKFDMIYKPNYGVYKDSKILLWYLKTFSKQRFLKKLGALNKKELATMKKIIAKLFTNP